MLILRVSFSSQFSRLFSFFSYQYTKSPGALPCPTFRWQTFGLSIYEILFPVPHLVKDYLFGGLRCHYPTFVWHPTSSSLSSSSQQKELHLWFFWGDGGKHWYIRGGVVWIEIKGAKIHLFVLAMKRWFLYLLGFNMIVWNQIMQKK